MNTSIFLPQNQESMVLLVFCHDFRLLTMTPLTAMFAY